MMSWKFGSRETRGILWEIRQRSIGWQRINMGEWIQTVPLENTEDVIRKIWNWLWNGSWWCPSADFGIGGFESLGYRLSVEGQLVRHQVESFILAFYTRGPGRKEVSTIRSAHALLCMTNFYLDGQILISDTVDDLQRSSKILTDLPELYNRSMEIWTTKIQAMAFQGSDTRKVKIFLKFS